MKNSFMFLLLILLGVYGIANAEDQPAKADPAPIYLNPNMTKFLNTFFAKFPNGVLIEKEDKNEVTFVNPNFITYSPLEKLVIGYFETNGGTPVNLSPGLPTPSLYLTLSPKKGFSYFSEDSEMDFQYKNGELNSAGKNVDLSTFSFDISKAVEFRGQTVTACFYNPAKTSEQTSVTIKIGSVQTFSHGFVISSPLFSARNIQGGTTFVTGADGDIIQQLNIPVGLYYGAEIFLAPRCFEYENECIDQDPLKILNPFRWNFIAGINVQAPTSGFLLGAEWELIKRIPIVFAWTPTLYNTLPGGEVAGEPVNGIIAMNQEMDWSNFSVGIDLYPLIGQTLLGAIGNSITAIFGTPSSNNNGVTNTSGAATTATSN